MPIKITSKRHNFRRCGMEHPKGATVYPDGKFTQAEIASLKAEPMLAVEIVEAPDEAQPETRNPKPKTRK